MGSNRILFFEYCAETGSALRCVVMRKRERQYTHVCNSAKKSS